MKPPSFAVIFIVLILPCLYAGSENFNTGSPFGPIDGTAIERLAQFSKTKGIDLVAEMQKAYSKDEDALARVFGFCIYFDSLDQNARAYGQIVYSSMLNLGEAWGIDKFSQVLANQDTKVQQRIRDFLFYDITQAPKDQRMQIEAQVRSDYPTLFPPDYVFGRDDPVFSDSTKKRREETQGTVLPLMEGK